MKAKDLRRGLRALARGNRLKKRGEHAHAFREHQKGARYLMTRRTASPCGRLADCVRDIVAARI